MIRNKNRLVSRDIVIDLTGPDGNAFVLMGYAMKFAKMVNYTTDEISKLMFDMQSSDYENLVNVFDKHFGSFVILER